MVDLPSDLGGLDRGRPPPAFVDDGQNPRRSLALSDPMGADLTPDVEIGPQDHRHGGHDQAADKRQCHHDQLPIAQRHACHEQATPSATNHHPLRVSIGLLSPGLRAAGPTP